MSRLKKLFAISCLLVLTMAVPSMAAQRFYRPHYFAGPRVVIRPYSYWGPGWYGYWGTPYYYGPAYAVPNTGEVKIDTHLKDALLYVDGGYVGPVNKFKKFDLRPGPHDLEIRDASGNTIYKERVDVLLNKTTEIRLPS